MFCFSIHNADTYNNNLIHQWQKTALYVNMLYISSAQSPQKGHIAAHFYGYQPQCSHSILDQFKKKKILSPLVTYKN